ncbi:terpene synthase family protein [Aspergillus stella-maris]|uniref:terpene synthase family protein n=1 Tax=Aspergillus stella-maris TaxID=1810926 RepID=UPI003CCD1AAB
MLFSAGTKSAITFVKNAPQLFLDWMLVYVASVSNVDSFFTGDDIPSLDKYWERRELTAAVYSVMALIPFAHGFDIKKEDVEDDNMMLLWKHASYLVHITNDMFSFRKEFNDNQLENLIPITMAHTGLTANQTMQLAYHICLTEVDGFNSRAKALRKSSGYSTKTESLIRGCEDVYMGLIHWSYSGQRYFKTADLDSEFRVSFALGSPSASLVSSSYIRALGNLARPASLSLVLALIAASATLATKVRVRA